MQRLKTLIIGCRHDIHDTSLIRKLIVMAFSSGLPLSQQAVPILLRPGRGLSSVLSFHDHGIGISNDHLSRIFDPYFTTEQRGSGLGLTTSYSIIKKHDGQITRKSLLGIGTIIRIYLPVPEVTVVKKDVKKGITLERHRKNSRHG